MSRPDPARIVSESPYHLDVEVDDELEAEKAAYRREILSAASRDELLSALAAIEDEFQDDRDIVEADRRAGQLPEPKWAAEAPEPEPIRWVVEDLFPQGEVGLIAGEGGTFKSTIALHIAAAVAGGYPAFDRFKTSRAGAVLYCSAEDSENILMLRLNAIIRGHDWDATRVREMFGYYALEGMNISDARWQSHLLNLCTLDYHVQLVILDPLIDIAGMDEENSNAEAAKIMNFARALARHAKAAVIFVHHANKAAANKTAGDASQAYIRGASAIANASRSTLFLEKTPEKEVTVRHYKMSYADTVEPFALQRTIRTDTGNRTMLRSLHITTRKAADARAERARAFVLAQVALYPRELTTNKLKEAAKGSGMWRDDVGAAVKQLYAEHRIDFEPGPRRAQLWYPVATFDRAVGTRPSGENDRADRAEPAAAQSNDVRLTEPALTGPASVVGSTTGFGPVMAPGLPEGGWQESLIAEVGEP